MRPSARPFSRSTLRTTSGSNSFMPTKSICAIAGRSLHQHDQHVVLHLEAHVLEEAGGVQGAQRALRLLLVHGFADLDRQVAEHRARLGALQALDADVLDDEGPERSCGAAALAATATARHDATTAAMNLLRSIQPVSRRFRSL